MISNRHIESDEEFKRELEELFRRRYGTRIGNIQVQQVSQQQAKTAPAEEPEPLDLEFDLKPKEVKEHLDRYVIGQDDAKKALAIAVCDHYKHAIACESDPKRREQEYSKQNVIMIGPTGVGKTYLVRTLARLIGVPFVKADATKFSETGYVGGNVEDLVRDLVTQADGNLQLAQYGMIYLDEVDKIATPRNVMGRDVSGRGVQMNLLKLMEETEVDLNAPHDVAAQMRMVMQFQQKGEIEKQMINTRHILFIMSGAFSGLNDIIKKRMNRQAVGFSADVRSEAEEPDYLQYVTSRDFVEFGFEPEFIGRLPVHVVCHDLTEDDLFDILKHSEGSIIRQYRLSFQAYGIDSPFTDDGLRALASAAYKERTGARGLMTVCERTLRDFKYELPSSEIKQFVVDAQLVNQPEEELRRILDEPDYVKGKVLREQLRQYQAAFHHDHGIHMDFDDDAIERLCLLAGKMEVSIENLCDELFKSYEHGLNLIKKNTGRDRFQITTEVIEDPDGVLETWIRESYSAKETLNQSS